MSPSSAAGRVTCAFLATLAVCAMFAVKAAAYCSGGCACCDCRAITGASQAQCLGSASDCMEACGGGRSGGSGGGSYNSGYDAAAAAAAAPRAAQLAAEKKAREEEEERRRVQEEQERQARFEKEKQEIVGQLHEAGTGSHTFGQGLRGETPMLQLRDGSGSSGGGSHEGPRAAWAQLNCSADLAKYAYKALRLSGGRGVQVPDFGDFAYYAGQASNALAGEEMEVQCEHAPMPAAYGKKGYEAYQAKYKRMLEESRKLVRRLRLVMEARRAAAAKEIARLETEQRAGSLAHPEALQELRQAKASLDEFHKAEAARPQADPPAEDDGDAMAAALAAYRKTLEAKSYAELTKEQQRQWQDLLGQEKAVKALDSGSADALSALDSQFGPNTSPK